MGEDAEGLEPPRINEDQAFNVQPGQVHGSGQAYRAHADTRDGESTEYRGGIPAEPEEARKARVPGSTGFACTP